MNDDTKSNDDIIKIDAEQYPYFTMVLNTIHDQLMQERLLRMWKREQRQAEVEEQADGEEG